MNPQPEALRFAFNSSHHWVNARGDLVGDVHTPKTTDPRRTGHRRKRPSGSGELTAMAATRRVTETENPQGRARAGPNVSIREGTICSIHGWSGMAGPNLLCMGCPLLVGSEWKEVPGASLSNNHPQEVHRSPEIFFFTHMW